MLRAVRFKDVTVGDEFGDIATISEWHILTASSLFYDAGPNHVNPRHSAHNRFGGQIAPGFLTTGIMMGVAGRYFGWSIEAFLDTHITFRAPVYLGDTVDILWRVTNIEPKDAFNGGIVHLSAWSWTHADDTGDGTLTVEMTAKLGLNDADPPELHQTD